MRKEEQLNENQKFLQNEKKEIIRLIREKKIEKAMELIEKTVPAILAEDHIVAFMKGHIFLRIIKEGS